MLLNPDPRLFAMLTALQQVSGNSHLPYRISETNSFSGGGRRGISDSFGAALWVLDYLFTLASFGAAGVNLETGVNQLGFISSYSPIGDDEHGTYTALPGYYGMLAFSQAARGHRVDAEAKAGDLRFSAYAVVEDGRVVSTLINKDRVRSAPVEVRCNRPILRASALRLEAASLASTSGVTLGGATVTAEGLWKAMPPEELAVISGGARMVVPPGSAALLTLGL
jgi:hypothetical protein